MSVKERILQYVRYKKISNSAFCRTIGVSNAFISSMRKSIQPDKVESIALSFPDLNVGWLLTGEGDMLKDLSLPDPPLLSHETTEVSRMMRELLRAKDQIIEEKDHLLTEKDKRLHLLEQLLEHRRKVGALAWN